MKIPFDTLPRLLLRISSCNDGPARRNIRFDIMFFSVKVSSVVFVTASTSSDEISPSLRCVELEMDIYSSLDRVQIWNNAITWITKLKNVHKWKAKKNGGN